MVALKLLTRLRNVSPRAAPVTAVPVTVVPATPTLLRIVALTVRTLIFAHVKKKKKNPAFLRLLGSSVNSCSVGLFVDTIDNSTYYLWNCQGTDKKELSRERRRLLGYLFLYHTVQSLLTASGGAVSFSSPWCFLRYKLSDLFFRHFCYCYGLSVHRLHFHRLERGLY